MNTWTVKVRWRFEGYINTTHSCPSMNTWTVKVRWRFEGYINTTQSCPSLETWTVKVRWRFQVTLHRHVTGQAVYEQMGGQGNVEDLGLSNYFTELFVYEHAGSRGNEV